MYTTLVERILREATIEIEKFPKRNIPLEFLSVVSRELIRHSRGKNIFRIIRNIFDDPLYTFRRRLEDKLIFICARLEIIDDWWGQRVKGASSGTTVESRSGQPRVFETNYAVGGRRLHRPKYKAQMPVFAVIICLEEFKK